MGADGNSTISMAAAAKRHFSRSLNPPILLPLFPLSTVVANAPLSFLAGTELLRGVDLAERIRRLTFARAQRVPSPPTSIDLGRLRGTQRGNERRLSSHRPRFFRRGVFVFTTLLRQYHICGASTRLLGPSTHRLSPPPPLGHGGIRAQGITNHATSSCTEHSFCLDGQRKACKRPTRTCCHARQRRNI